MTDKVTIVGESNPYGGDDCYALYPAPDGCSGHRLCCLILGMTRHDYLEAFSRINLVRGKWSIKEARKIAGAVEGRKILLGSKVSAAFGVPFTPFVALDDKLILPHPSGLCRLWNETNAIKMARSRVKSFAPEMAHLIGKADSNAET